jgi:hypothetical protein
MRSNLAAPTETAMAAASAFEQVFAERIITGRKCMIQF